jgi:hypothetical protein
MVGMAAIARPRLTVSVEAAASAAQQHSLGDGGGGRGRGRGCGGGGGGKLGGTKRPPRPLGWQVDREYDGTEPSRPNAAGAERGRAHGGRGAGGRGNGRAKAAAARARGDGDDGGSAGAAGWLGGGGRMHVEGGRDDAVGTSTLFDSILEYSSACPSAAAASATGGGGGGGRGGAWLGLGNSGDCGIYGGQVRRLTSCQPTHLRAHSLAFLRARAVSVCEYE